MASYTIEGLRVIWIWHPILVCGIEQEEFLAMINEPGGGMEDVDPEALAALGGLAGEDMDLGELGEGGGGHREILYCQSVSTPAILDQFASQLQGAGVSNSAAGQDMHWALCDGSDCGCVSGSCGAMQQHSGVGTHINT